MIVALPIEVSAREFYSKLFCAYQIIKHTRHEVLIGKKSEVYSIFKNNKNIYLLSKGGSFTQFQFKKESLKDNFLGILDEEGPLINLTKTDFETRTDKRILNNVKNYYCWGKQDYLLLKKKIDKSKLILSGHPKFDLCNNHYNKIFKKKVRILKNKFGKYCLIPSSFIGNDAYFVNEIYKKWMLENTKKNLKVKKKKELDEYFLNDGVTYYKLIKIIKKLSTENKDINFIFRPHPIQDPYKVEKNFNGKYKNIFVVNDDIITPYIQACEYFIHSGCTTSFEAAALNKKIFYIKNKAYEKKSIYEKFSIILNEKNFSKFNKLTKKKAIKKKLFVNKIIENITSNSFHEKLIEVLKKYNQKNSEIKYNIKVNKLNKIKSIIKNILLNKITYRFFSLFNSNFILQKSYTDSKFQNFSPNDISDKINTLAKLDKSKIKLKILKIGKSSFLIKRLKKKMI